MEFWWAHINSSRQNVNVCLETLKPWSLRKIGCKPHHPAMSTISNRCAVGSKSACGTLGSELIVIGVSQRGWLLASAPKPWKHLSWHLRRLCSLNECQSAVQFSIIFQGLGWGESRERKRCFDIEEGKHHVASFISHNHKLHGECSHKHCDWAHLIHCLSIPILPLPTLHPPQLSGSMESIHFLQLIVGWLSTDPSEAKGTWQLGQHSCSKNPKEHLRIDKKHLLLGSLFERKGNFQDKHNFFMSYWIKSSNLQK